MDQTQQRRRAVVVLTAMVALMLAFSGRLAGADEPDGIDCATGALGVIGAGAAGIGMASTPMSLPLAVGTGAGVVGAGIAGAKQMGDSCPINPAPLPPPAERYNPKQHQPF